MLLVARILLAEETGDNLKIFDLDEIVVTATKTDRILADVAETVSVITEEQIKQSNAQTVGDLLKYIPGLEMSQSDDYPGVSTWKATLRGLSVDNGYGLLLIVGERAKGRGMGEYGNGLNQILVEMIERIEIVKGPGSVLYGSDALGGVINIITKPVASDETTSIYADYGTEQTTRQGFSYSNRFEKSGFRTSAGMERTNIGEYEGRFLNNKFSYNLNESKTFTLNMDLNEQKTPSKDERRIRISPKFNMNLGKGSQLIFKGYWFDWDFVQSSREGDIYYHQAETQYTRFLSNRHKVTAGLEYLRQTLDYQYDGGNTWSYVKEDIDTYSSYLQDELFLLDNVYVVIGARFDSHSTFGEVLSPRISGLVDITEKIRLRTSIGRSFKSPTIRQLYYPAPFRHSSSEYVISNPDLKPEYGIGYSLGLEKEFGSIMLGNVTVFRNDLDDMVISYFTGESFFDKTLKSYENVAEAYTRGVESELKIRLFKDITSTLSYTFIDTKDKETGNKLRYIPDNNAGWRLHYNNRNKNFGIGCGLRFISSMYKDVENTDKTDSYYVAEVKLTKKVTASATLSLDIGNLFDTEYGDPSIEREGRSFISKLSLNF